MAEREPVIGDLRWECTLAYRKEDPDGDVGITESYVNLATVHCDIRPVGTMIFLTGMQTEGPVTHKIWLRWLDCPEMFTVILRDTIRPDGSTRHEVFRVRRSAEVAGRKRWIVAECELETISP